MISEKNAKSLLSEMKSVANSIGPRNNTVSIDHRVCESDKNTGVDIYLKGQTVRIRPFIEKISELESWKIESINMVSDADETKCPECESEIFDKSVVMFCAYVGSSEELKDIFV